ncbi:hypothetical protein [Flavilitoribacter nigricans]|uniref:Uncharacterized protein n=1 Tax=Flavilitoribacter nigricans (strain ATCC 23147 / DSM 23189 / NBRC 102662 / NCIMB 1420 / SS-2) TaxID=1122177 RepID=A0A2D0N8I8_FLAN2|nr:hypothetical protein [Flavilitoribacter nigricans]PHN04469.1 hypothetical protein CRP01_20895 [Flavilitoribacter nigricans DSM 23189 = NBRC 102662]
MNLQQAKVLLKKINTLNDSLSLDNGPIASIERDLMLSYIRQLYEAYLDGASNGSVNNSGTKTARATSGGSNPELEIVAPPTEKEAAPEPPKRKYTPPKIIEISDAPAEPAKVSQPAPPPPKPVQRTTPAPTPTPRPEPTFSQGSSNPKVKALFDQREAKELSEKLSLQPLRDLTKGLSINDRLLYTNDLFNKDANLFNAALKQLNDMDNMDQARAYLEEQADRYDWTDGEKSDVARDFIKHVRRRFV